MRNIAKKKFVVCANFLFWFFVFSTFYGFLYFLLFMVFLYLSNGRERSFGGELVQ